MARNLATQHILTLGHRQQQQHLQLVQEQGMQCPLWKVRHQTAAAAQTVQDPLTHLHHTHRMRRAQTMRLQLQLHPMSMECLVEAKAIPRQGTRLCPPPETRMAAPRLHQRQHQQLRDIRIRLHGLRSNTYTCDS